jgi:hypothetical protein
MARGEDPGSTVIVGEFNFRLQGIVFAALSGALLAVAPPSFHRDLVRHVPVAGAVAYLIVVGALTAWFCSRAWRIALRMDDLGITVRNLFLTHRFSWTEVRCFADGAFRGDSATIHWALKVVPYDTHARRGAGRPVTATATARRRDEAEVMAVLRHAVEHHGMAAEWTGTASGPVANRWHGVSLIVLLLLMAWL